MMASAARRRSAHACAAALALALAAPAAAQPPAPQPAPAPAKPSKEQQRERIATAAQRWLEGDQTARDELDALVARMLEEPELGIDWLAAQLPDTLAAPALPRARSVHALVGHFTLGYMHRQRATKITFQGQYGALARLQPVAGDFLFGLLLETPDWYPTTHRIQLVAPLRDLQPRLPEAARADAVERVAENTAVEPENLRRALAALLWQWGRKQTAQAIVQRLVTATGEGAAEERVQTTLELADFWCQLREYKQAAGSHRAAQVLAKENGVGLRPIAWYAAACVHALLGDVERGLAAIDECAALLASSDLDASLRLPRSMFDNDPELAPLRGLPRWEQAMRRAFPAAAPAGTDGGRGR
jgi:hypothetical protein